MCVEQNERNMRLVSTILICVVILAAEVAPAEPEPERSCRGEDPSWLLDDDFSTREFVVPQPNDNDPNNLRTLTIEKLSSHPPIFRIPHFLTPDECEKLRRAAVQQGMHRGVIDSNTGLSSTTTAPKKQMGIFDANQDLRLSVTELIRMMDDFFESHLDADDIRDMMSYIGLPLLNDDSTVSIQDFLTCNKKAMYSYVTQLMDAHPSKRHRHSSMSWLKQQEAANDAVNNEQQVLLESIQARVAALTRLPESVVRHKGMELQVVHYEPRTGGHYTAHYDSLDDTDTECCHIVGRRPPCRPCRLATVLYSLSDSSRKEGGHTAFPLAATRNNIPMNHTAESVQVWRFSSASRESSYCSPGQPGLRIQPRLGQAILWYNHELHPRHDNNTTEDINAPLLGPLDRSTIHAGCPTMTRQPQQQHAEEEPWNAPGKWIANHWIEASPIPGQDEAHYRNIMEQEQPPPS